jgi:protein SCO1/2
VSAPGSTRRAPAAAAAAIVVVAALALGARARAAHEPSRPVAAAQETVGPSLYPMSMTLVDQTGARVGFDAFRGHPVVVSMFYASCPAACPLLVSRMKQIDHALPAAARADARYLLVSFDPAHDTPSVLAATAAAHQVDARWRFATGSDDDVQRLAGALDIAYARLAGGGFTHASVLTVLDGQGRVVARTDDPDSDLAPLVAAVTRAAR